MNFRMIGGRPLRRAFRTQARDRASSESTKRRKLPLLFDQFVATGEHQDAMVIQVLARLAAILLRIEQALWHAAKSPTRI
jgi:hypothetical protein